MKYLVLLCLLAVSTAEEEQNQEKKTQTPDNTQGSLVGLSQTTGTLLNTQAFPTNFNVFGTKDSVQGVPYTGFGGNISPIQGINPDFFASAPALVNGAIPTFPVTRTVLPATSGVVNGIQSGFPVTGGVLPSVPVVNTLGAQFPATANGIYQGITGVPGVTGGALTGNTPVVNTALNSATGAFRFLSPEGFSGVPAQAFQAPQGLVQGGLSAVPAFTSGILPPVSNGVVSAGQTGVLKNPTKVQF